MLIDKLQNFLFSMYNSQFEKLTKKRESLADRTKHVITNTAIDLDMRWKIYVAACKNQILPFSDYIQHIASLNDVSWYDDFYKDKYAVVNWPDVIESIEDSDESQNIYAYLENIDLIKEQIMSAGFAGFTNDW